MMKTTRPKILIIESAKKHRDYLNKLLTTNQYNVETAQNGREGIQKILKFHPDVILTDIVMPEVDGIEVIMHVRRKKFDTKIIAMASTDNKFEIDYLDIASTLGADLTLEKPFTQEMLIQGIEKILPETVNEYEY